MKRSMEFLNRSQRTKAASASVVVAIFIGGIEALGLLSDQLGLAGGFWDWIGALNDNLTNFGYAVVGVFVLSWIVSTLFYRLKGYDSLGTPEGGPAG